MANAEHVERLRAGVQGWNAWRDANPDLAPDLSGADLRSASLRRANLRGVDLSGATLSASALRGADVLSANLADARGLDGIGAVRVRNLLLARFSPETLRTLALDPAHNERVRERSLAKLKRAGLDFTNADLSGYDLSDAELPDSHFVGCDLREANLTGADLSWSTFERADLTNAKLRRANLAYCNLRDARLQFAVLRQADLRLADFAGADVYFADLRQATFRWRGERPDVFASRNHVVARFSEALADELGLRPRDGSAFSDTYAVDEELDDGEVSSHHQRLEKRSLAGYDLSHRNFDGIDLAGWDLSNVRCHNTSLRNANLTGTNLTGARLTRASLAGARLERAVLTGALLERADLTGAQLQRAQLERADLTAAVLEQADLSHATLSRATLPQAKAAGASFREASLDQCDVRGADLERADLSGAVLDDAKLDKTRLASANLQRASVRRVKALGSLVEGARLDEANVDGADFRHAVGLSAEQVAVVRNARLAQFPLDLLTRLRVDDPERHNERARTKNFSGLDLQRCDLRDADLSDAELEGASLGEAVLDGASLARAKLARARLDRASLVGTDLTAADLAGASLRGARLDGAQLDAAVLAGADLREATLKQTRVGTADLRGVSLRDAVLEGADLAHGDGLHAEQLAATNLNGAKLPAELGEFSALRNIEGITAATRRLILADVLLCAYTAVQVASLTDADLLANRNIMSSPLLDLHTPALFFCFGGPLVLLVLYVWTQFYLQHVWEELAQLPAIFPDSRPLYKKVYPSFLNSFVSAHVPILKSDRPLLTHLQILSSVLMTWWLVPATIALMWARYLSAHHQVGTALQLAALGYAVLAGVLLQRLAGATLSGARREPARLRLPRRGEARAIAAVLAVVAAFALYSWGAVAGCGVRASAGRAGAAALVADAARRLCVRADLVEAEVSTKNAGWRGEERALVTGARLAGRDLQRARARGAFLAKANLTRARLQEADLRGADLRWADLTDARLDSAILVGADLRAANLRGAHLDGAWLHGARVRAADTAGVDLRKALGVKRLIVER